MDKMILLLACFIAICSATGKSEMPSSEMGPSPTTPPLSSLHSSGLKTSDVHKSSSHELRTSDVHAPSSHLPVVTSDVHAPSSRMPVVTSDMHAPSSHMPVVSSDVHAPSSHMPVVTSDVHAPSSHIPVASSPSPSSLPVSPSSKHSSAASSPSSSSASPSSSSAAPSPSNSTSTLPSPSPTTSPSNSSTTPTPSNSTAPPTPSNSSTTPTPSNSTAPPTPSNSTAPPTPSNSTAPPIPSNSSTSPSPSNSTYHPHSTHVQPTPTPTPYPGYVSYKVKNGNTTCLLLKGSIKFQINYHVKGNKKMLSKTIQLPSNATVNGSCGEKANKSYVSLKFESLTFTWKFEIEKSKSWKSANMSLSGSISGIKGPVPVDSVLVGADNDKFLTASKQHSYECMREEKVTLSDDVVVIFEKIQVQPFYVTDGKFGKAESCPSTKKSSSNDIVPIAVGCALAGLIVIVLIAYLIGRRKTSNRGYEQV